MKIKLIKPAVPLGSESTQPNSVRLQDVALPLLAALTPEKHTVTIVDESFAPDNTDEDVDLVGLTVWTDLARRSYRIADQYRKRGVMVAMGGIHPTMVPEEVAEHCDAVVVGEGERAWPQLVRDAEAGKLQKFYRAAILPTLDGLPIPRRDLYPRLAYWNLVPLSVGIEASRGCIYDCEFCSVLKVRGHTYRVRPAKEIIREIETIASNYLVFVDDNTALNRKAARELFRAMIPLKRQWVAEANASLAHDPELLTLMKLSGCVGLKVGFESVQKDTIQQTKKLKHLKVDYAEALHRFHDAGIAVFGNFVFGFDYDTPDVFDQTLEFAVREKLDFGQFRELVPYPGTPLYDRLRAEGRLIDPQWWLNPDRKFGDATPAFSPRRMSPQQLIDGLAYVSKEFYSVPSIVKRFFGIKPGHRSLLGVSLHLTINWFFGRRYRSLYDTPTDGGTRLPGEGRASLLHDRTGAVPSVGKGSGLES